MHQTGQLFSRQRWSHSLVHVDVPFSRRGAGSSLHALACPALGQSRVIEEDAICRGGGREREASEGAARAGQVAHQSPRLRWHTTVQPDTATQTEAGIAASKKRSHLPDFSLYTCVQNYSYNMHL